MPTRLQIARKDILDRFEREGPRVYLLRDISKILEAERSGWRLAQATTTSDLIQLLGSGKAGRLRTVRLKPQEGASAKAVTRYVWGEVSPFALALTVRPGSYVSHGSAVFFHGLNELLPRSIYVNQEQSAKPKASGALTQERIHAAFRRRQRSSNYVLTFGEYDVVVLNGKSTGRLEVESLLSPEGQVVDVTSVERTLIDIAVRPSYAGGVEQVLAAYEGAKERLSSNVMLRTLEKLAYVYPYHQAIGFYMERAGYPEERIRRLRSIPIEFDFYLCYGAGELDYDARWRLFYPKGM